MIYQFSPYYRPMIWGCEQWIISAYPQKESKIIAGPYAGATLTHLLTEQGRTILGDRLWHQFGAKFPLLIKFIESNSPLSIQVHPSDEQAQKHGKGLVGKTEMWYVLPSKDDAYLYSGLKAQLTPDTYKQHVNNHTIVDDLARYTIKEGDCFFLPSGRIHAIGSGCNLLEIQQSSDITYRIYDYDRRDCHGNLRELHTDLAAEVIDYQMLPDYQTHYTHMDNAPVSLISCPYFETHVYHVTDQVHIDWSKQDRFLILIFTAGHGVLIADNEQRKVSCGNAILLPATTNNIQVTGHVSFVTITINL